MTSHGSDGEEKEGAATLLHCVPPQNIRNALHLLSCTDGDEISVVKNHHCFVPFAVVNPINGKPFLASTYNKKNHQHRSPWDNAFHPRDDGAGESSTSVDGNEADLRYLEITFNEVWSAYTALYYGHEAIGSVYLKSTGNGSFEGLLGIQKVCPAGSWNSASHVTVKELTDRGEFFYHVESMVQCILEPKIEEFDRSSVSAIVSKTSKRTCTQSRKVPGNICHIETLGTMIEINEIDLRSNLEKVLLPKNQEAIDSLLAKNPIGIHNGVNPIVGMMMNSDMMKRRLTKQST